MIIWMISVSLNNKIARQFDFSIFFLIQFTPSLKDRFSKLDLSKLNAWMIH